METNQILSRKFVNTNTNNLYYERSLKVVTLVSILLVCLLVMVSAVIVYKYANRQISSTEMVTSFSFVALVSIGLIFGFKPLIKTSHLFPKKVTDFMVKFKDYNDRAIEILQDALQDGEHLVFNEGVVSVKDQISALCDEYDWLEDPIIVTPESSRYEAYSLVHGYINQLSTVKTLTSELRINAKSLRDARLENMKRAGLYLNKADDFKKASQILEAEISAREYYSNLNKHLTQRIVLGKEIDEYFAVLTRPGLTFVQDS